VLVAAADRFAELRAFLLQAAAEANGRRNPGPDEQGTHQNCREDQIRDQQLAGHALPIGREMRSV